MRILYELRKGEDTIKIHEDGGTVTGEFVLDGKKISPFYSHPWPEDDKTGLIGFLKGDFFCAPFGIRPSNTIQGYEPAELSSEKEYAHGYSSNGKWEQAERSDDKATITLKYKESVIDKVDRKVSFLEDRIGISFKNSVFVNENTNLPIGAHPIFRLPERTGAAKLVLPKYDKVYTYPIKTDETSMLKTNQAVNDISKMPMANGKFIDMTHLPLESATEEVIMLAGVEDGRVCLENHDEGYRAVLEFEADKIPNFLLWVSNRGRQFEPWNGRNLCLGIEPVASAFDFGTDISRSNNALSKQGVKTCVHIEKDSPFEFSYQIYIEKL